MVIVQNLTPYGVAVPKADGAWVDIPDRTKSPANIVQFSDEDWNGNYAKTPDGVESGKRGIRDIPTIADMLAARPVQLRILDALPTDPNSHIAAVANATAQVIEAQAVNADLQNQLDAERAKSAQMQAQIDSLGGPIDKKGKAASAPGPNDGVTS